MNHPFEILQAELREELLRRSQTQISSRDRAIEERDAVITKLEKDLVKLKIEQDEDVPDNLKETKKRSPFTEDGKLFIHKKLKYELKL